MGYFPAKILEVFRPKDEGVDSADLSYQALIEIWNGANTIADLPPVLADKAKKNDYILVTEQLNPQGQITVRVITKILKTKGKTTFETFQKGDEKIKQKQIKQMQEIQGQQPTDIAMPLPAVH